MADKEDQNVAASLGLAELDTEEAIGYISKDILRQMYRAKPVDDFEKELNKKIEKVYGEWTGGSKWYQDNDKVQSVLLLGPPGQGKTTAFKEAARKVSAALEMNFVLNPDDEFTPTKSDFMFVSMECSGENSAMAFGGIPSKMVDEASGIEYMSKLVNKRLAMAKVAGGALMLLDDFPNATPTVQNVGLSLTDEKRFQGLNLEHVYVGLTGNLGSLDGTHTSKLSTALRGRCQVYYTQDKLTNYVSRVQQKYRDELGDAGVVGFLLRNPTSFFQFPSTKQSGGYPSSRTWDHFVVAARRAIADKGGRGRGEVAALRDIKNFAVSNLGPDVGLQMEAYYHSLMIGADPIAREMIQNGKFDEKAFKERFKDGYSSDAQNFGYQYAIALADYTVQMIVQDPKNNFKTAIERFGTGIIPVNQDQFSFAIDHFKAKLANQVDEFSNKILNRRVLTTDTKRLMAKIIAESKDFTLDRHQVLVDALSDANKHDDIGTGPRRKR